VPRLLAAPAPTVEGSEAVRAMSAGRPKADSSGAAPAVIETTQELQRWPDSMPRIRSAAKTSSILALLGLRRGDGQAELDDLVGGQARADAASNNNEPLQPNKEGEHGPTSIPVAAWRQGVDLAASAARQLQAALLGFNPLPARAHFGSHTYLRPVAAPAPRIEDGGGIAPQSPEER